MIEIRPRESKSWCHSGAKSFYHILSPRGPLLEIKLNFSVGYMHGLLCIRRENVVLNSGTWSGGSWFNFNFILRKDFFGGRVITHQNYEMQGKNKRIGSVVFDEYWNRNHKIKAQAFLINFHCKLYIKWDAIINYYQTKISNKIIVDYLQQYI